MIIFITHLYWLRWHWIRLEVEWVPGVLFELLTVESFLCLFVTNAAVTHTDRSVW